LKDSHEVTSRVARFPAEFGTDDLVLAIRVDGDEAEVIYPPEPGPPADVLPFRRVAEEEA